jgi:hypothetical protein
VSKCIAGNAKDCGEFLKKASKKEAAPVPELVIPVVGLKL